MVVEANGIDSSIIVFIGLSQLPVASIGCNLAADGREHSRTSDIRKNPKDGYL